MLLSKRRQAIAFIASSLLVSNASSFVIVNPTSNNIVKNTRSSFKYPNQSDFTSQGSKSKSQLNVIDPSILTNLDTATLTTAAATAAPPTGLFSLESIKTAFSVATFGPQPFWLLMILLPKNQITKTLWGDLKIPLLFSLVHFYIVFSSILQPDGTAPMVEFNDVFDPSGDPQKAMMGMMKYPNFVSEEWSHVLTWDLFVGRYVWLDGLKRNIITWHSVTCEYLTLSNHCLKKHMIRFETIYFYL